MADTLLPQFIAELEANLADKKETLEGFYDLAGAHEITPEMARENQEAIVDYERRRDHLQRTLDECRGLATDGHPSMDDRMVETAVFDDVKQQEKSVAKAASKFKPRQADKIDLATSVIEPKGRP